MDKTIEREQVIEAARVYLRETIHSVVALPEDMADFAVRQSAKQDAEIERLQKFCKWILEHDFDYKGSSWQWVKDEAQAALSPSGSDGQDGEK